MKKRELQRELNRAMWRIARLEAKLCPNGKHEWVEDVHRDCEICARCYRVVSIFTYDYEYPTQ